MSIFSTTPHLQAFLSVPETILMACKTFSPLSLIALNIFQSSKDILRPKGVNSGACMTAEYIGESKVGDGHKPQDLKLEVIEHLELHRTECQVDA